MNDKKKFFKSKIQQVTRAIWDLEFKLFKVREMREERRKQRDRAVETIDALDLQLPKSENTEETKKLLMEKRAEQQKYKDHVTDQMEALDMEINGKAGTDTEQAYIGVIVSIDSARELLQMYKDYLKNNC